MCDEARGSGNVCVCVCVSELWYVVDSVAWVACLSEQQLNEKKGIKKESKQQDTHIHTKISGALLHDDSQAKVCDLDWRVWLLACKQQVLRL